MGDTTIKCWCTHCKQELEPSHTGSCTNCGKIGKDCSVTIKATIGIKAGFKAVLKRQGVKKFVLEIISRWLPSRDPKLPNGVQEDRVIDRERDEYRHTVTDAISGEVIHEEREPLSKHKTTSSREAGQ